MALATSTVAALAIGSAALMTGAGVVGAQVHQSKEQMRHNARMRRMAQESAARQQRMQSQALITERREEASAARAIEGAAARRRRYQRGFGTPTIPSGIGAAPMPGTSLGGAFNRKTLLGL